MIVETDSDASKIVTFGPNGLLGTLVGAFGVTPEQAALIHEIYLAYCEREGKRDAKKSGAKNGHTNGTNGATNGAGGAQ